MSLFYSLGVNLYVLGIRISSLWNPKARKWVQGRRDVWQSLENFDSSGKLYWFHCASLGEFEQGRPLMERLKQEEACKIVVTFFSPSGYEIRKNYEGADLIIYLPKDSKKNARRFIDLLNPNAVFFVKYEFWAHYLLYCKQQNIPTYSISATFRKGQVFFKPLGGYMRNVLKSFDQIFVQDQDSKELLRSIEVESVVSGDTRFDRVMQNAEKVESYPDIQTFCGDTKVLICGSIWDEDLQVIKGKLNELDGWKIIIAPHEISDEFIVRIESSLKLKSARYSTGSFSNEDLLIIDNIGMLMNIYQYGDLAYIGGGFKTGLHNILEPAAFGLPVIFGDQVDKFPEAKVFVGSGVGKMVSNADQFNSSFDSLVASELKDEVKAFMKSHTGAVDKIIGHIKAQQS